MVIPESEFARRGDHAVGDMPVGLSRRDGEAARQHGTGQGDHDLVTGEEIAGPAHDAAHIRSPVGRLLALGRHTHLAPADGLAVRLRLLDELEHLADDDGPLEIEIVRPFLLEAHLHESGMDVVDRRIRGDVDVLAEPTDRNPHL